MRRPAVHGPWLLGAGPAFPTVRLATMTLCEPPFCPAAGPLFRRRGGDGQHGVDRPLALPGPLPAPSPHSDRPCPHGPLLHPQAAPRTGGGGGDAPGAGVG